MEHARDGRSLAGYVLKAIFVLALVSSVALGPDSVGRKNQSAPCSIPTLTGPATVALNETFVVTGCGFEAGQLIPFVGAEAGGCCWAINLVADSNGRFTYETWAWASGTYTYKALEEVRNQTRTAAIWSVDV